MELPELFPSAVPVARARATAYGTQWVSIGLRTRRDNDRIRNPWGFRLDGLSPLATFTAGLCRTAGCVKSTYPL